MPDPRRIANHEKQRGELHRHPDQGDGAIPEQIGLNRVGIGVFRVQPRDRIQSGHEDKPIGGQQQHPDPALGHADQGQGHVDQGHPERHGRSELAERVGRDHGPRPV